VARNLNTLEESGYIRRETSKNDKRVMLVYPTEKAFEVMAEINRIVNDCNTYFLSALNPCEREEFVRMLGKLELRASEYYNERGDGE
jgi:DNA-binding MarR family transcriptional regulator